MTQARSGSRTRRPPSAPSRRPPHAQRAANDRRREVAMALEEPALVVAAAEVVERRLEFLDRREATDPEELLLERSDEAFRDAVGLGFADEGGTRLGADEAQLLLVEVGDEGTAVVVADGQTT